MNAPTLEHLDEETIALVRLAAAIAGADDDTVDGHLRSAVAHVPPQWVEELLLQSHLFCGFPRALNAARQWRELSPASAANDETDDPSARDGWRLRGERVCALVYGERYERLRTSVRALHPALDDAMVVEGYGRILGRPGLDLPRRELCIVAACAITGQDRQLNSHLHGALNVGVTPHALTAALEALTIMVGVGRAAQLRRLRARVLSK